MSAHTVPSLEPTAAVRFSVPKDQPLALDSTAQSVDGWPNSLLPWITRLDYADAEAAAQAVATQLTRLNGERIRITLRQEINEAFFPPVQRLLAALERRLTGGSIPLPPAAKRAATQADQLLTSLTASYKLLLVEQGRRLFGFASSGRALLPLQRLLLLGGQRLVLTYRIYAQVPMGHWSELHEHYQFAARRGLSQRELAPGEATLVAIYKASLLLAFVDPLRLAPGDLDWVLAVIARNGDRSELGLAQERRGSLGAFLVRPGRDLPGYSVAQRQHDTRATAIATTTTTTTHSGPQHDLLLHTLPVAEALLADLARYSATGSPDSLGLPADADPMRVKELLGRLVKMWGAAPNRRFNRLRTDARVEVSAGVADIVANLLTESPNASPSEWTVTNESEQGFAITYVQGPTVNMRVGEVVGLRARDSIACHICVVRWVMADRDDKLQVGLEELARNARAAQVRLVRDAGSASIPALVLPEVPERGKGQSIVTANVGLNATGLNATCELSIGELQATLRVRPTQMLERTTSVDVQAFASVN